MDSDKDKIITRQIIPLHKKEHEPPGPPYRFGPGKFSSQIIQVSAKLWIQEKRLTCPTEKLA